MKCGVLHERAWHWLDRVYFEHYLPWRKTRVALLASEERRARVALGDKEGRGRPDTNWPWHVGPGVVVATDIASRAQALADPTRLMILRIIRRYRAGNTEIAGFLGLARPTVSVHAKILREAGLIDTRQEEPS